MNKKPINIISVLLILTLCSAMAYAYPVNFRIHGDSGNFNTVVYRCGDQDCNSMSASPISTDYGNPNSYTITGSGTQYFGEFDYLDCYLPQGYTVKTKGTDGAGPWDYYVNFNKGTDCVSNINSVTHSPSGTPQIGVQQTFTVNVRSAFEDNGVPPNTIPASIIPRYSSDITVELFVNSVLVDDEDVDVFMDDDDTVILRWTPTVKGDYDLEIRTSVPDCSCANYNTRHWYKSYTVANRAPVANDVSDSTNEDVPVTVDLDCTDDDGDSLTYHIVSNPSNGSLSGSGDSRTYTPGADFNGVDTFTYRCHDGDEYGNTATATVTVNPANDAPVAHNVNETTNQSTPITFPLNCTDVDGDNLTYIQVSSASHGAAFVVGGGAIYVPNTGYSGMDLFTYKCNDGTTDSNVANVSITVEEVVCFVDSDCGSSFTDNYCDASDDYVNNVTTPTCNNAGTTSSYCSNESVVNNTNCSYICDDLLGCDYTECSDSADNDNDTYIDYPLDPACDNYTDDNETGEVVCYTNSDCGVQFTDTFCDNLTYVTNVTTPHCNNPGTEVSYCSNESVVVNDTCNHICDDLEGCDYTECSD